MLILCYRRRPVVYHSQFEMIRKISYRDSQSRQVPLFVSPWVAAIIFCRLDLKSSRRDTPLLNLPAPKKNDARGVTDVSLEARRTYGKRDAKVNGAKSIFSIWDSPPSHSLTPGIIFMFDCFRICCHWFTQASKQQTVSNKRRMKGSANSRPLDPSAVYVIEAFGSKYIRAGIQIHRCCLQLRIRLHLALKSSVREWPKKVRLIASFV